jgi:hypothetical protein
MGVGRDMLLVASLFVVMSTLVPSLAFAAPTPSPKATSHSSASPARTPNPIARTPLSEANEFSVELRHESDLFWQGLLVGAGRTIVGLAWPMAVVLLALIARLAWEAYLERDGDDEKTDDSHAEAINANTSFSVTVAELQEVTEAAASLEKAFAALVTAKAIAKAPSPLSMMITHVPPGTGQDIEPLRGRLSEYARALCEVMLARQFEALALSAVRRLTYGEALAEYTAAKADGYTESISTWLGFLSRTGLARNVTTSGAMSSTVMEPTLLGFLVLSWCDSNGINANTIMRSSRGL